MRLWDLAAGTEIARPITAPFFDFTQHSRLPQLGVSQAKCAQIEVYRLKAIRGRYRFGKPAPVQSQTLKNRWRKQQDKHTTAKRIQALGGE
jgi:hypothetical protein